MASSIDLYDVLQVDKTADGPRIRAAFLELAQRCHPDLQRRADAAAVNDASFKQIRMAYEVLSDPTRRAAYDKNPAKYLKQPATRTPEVHRPKPRPAPAPHIKPPVDFRPWAHSVSSNFPIFKVLSLVVVIGCALSAITYLARQDLRRERIPSTHAMRDLKRKFANQSQARRQYEAQAKRRAETRASSRVKSTTSTSTVKNPKNKTTPAPTSTGESTDVPKVTGTDWWVSAYLSKPDTSATGVSAPTDGLYPLYPVDETGDIGSVESGQNVWDISKLTPDVTEPSAGEVNLYAPDAMPVFELTGDWKAGPAIPPRTFPKHWHSTGSIPTRAVQASTPFGHQGLDLSVHNFAPTAGEAKWRPDSLPTAPLPYRQNPITPWRPASRDFNQPKLPTQIHRPTFERQSTNELGERYRIGSGFGYGERDSGYGDY